MVGGNFLNEINSPVRHFVLINNLIVALLQYRDDPRVHLHFADGSKFLAETEDEYDVIIQDSSDPFTWDENGEKIELPSQSLYTKEHFQHIERSLSPDGVFNFQAETFNIESDLDGIVEWRKQALDVGFEDAQYGSITISTYPGGQIGFLLCTKSNISSSHQHEVENRFEKMVESGNDTEYYQPKLQQRCVSFLQSMIDFYSMQYLLFTTCIIFVVFYHHSAFDLPRWVEKRIYESESLTAEM